MPGLYAYTPTVLHCRSFYTALPTKIPFSFHNIFGTDLDWDTHTMYAH